MSHPRRTALLLLLAGCARDRLTIGLPGDEGARSAIAIVEDDALSAQAISLDHPILLPRTTRRARITLMLFDLPLRSLGLSEGELPPIMPGRTLGEIAPLARIYGVVRSGDEI